MTCNRLLWKLRIIMRSGSAWPFVALLHSKTTRARMHHITGLLESNANIEVLRSWNVCPIVIHLFTVTRTPLQDGDDNYNIIRMYEYFYFRNHLCITFELLSINLYEFIKNNNFQGLSLGLIRRCVRRLRFDKSSCVAYACIRVPPCRFAIQLLTSLKYLHRERVIHCDLKPENILLKSPTKSGIKIIDFGSSCFEDERGTPPLLMSLPRLASECCAKE